MPEDILSSLGLAPDLVPSLAASERSKLIGFLLRWQHLEAAHRCLQQLLVTHSHLVSVYDSLARVYLAQDRPQKAVEMMRRRHTLQISNSSQVLEARALRAAGFRAAAEKIGQLLVTEHPDLLLTWSLQAELKMAAGELDEAEDAWRQREVLRPGLAGTAQGIATVWQARSDPEKALLWARTALSRTQRDEGRPPVSLLILLESLYRDTGQTAQAADTASQMQRLEQQELDELRHALAPGPPQLESDSGTGRRPRPPGRASPSRLWAGDEPCQTGGAGSIRLLFRGHRRCRKPFPRRAESPGADAARAVRPRRFSPWTGRHHRRHIAG